MDEAYLARWIRLSESEEWFFLELQVLFCDMLDRQEEPPPVLAQWGREVAAGRRRKPTRRGRKSDPFADAQIEFAVWLSSRLFGESERTTIASVARQHLKSPEAIEATVRRARRWRECLFLSPK